MKKATDPAFDGIFDHLSNQKDAKEENEQREEPASNFFQDLIERMERQVWKACEKCGTEFKAQPETLICTTCDFQERYPEFQPKRWTWTPMGNQWGIIAVWPPKDADPEVGTTVTVHRKDGSTSQATISEVEGLRAFGTGQFKMFCRVINPRPYSPFPNPPVKE